MIFFSYSSLEHKRLEDIIENISLSSYYQPSFLTTIITNSRCVLHSSLSSLLLRVSWPVRSTVKVCLLLVYPFYRILTRVYVNAAKREVEAADKRSAQEEEVDKRWGRLRGW